MAREVILPGSTIGILGAGQLGKMTAMAAARLGYETVVWAPHREPAFDVASQIVQAGYDDTKAFADFVAMTDVITIEWENIPVELLEALAVHRPVRPSHKVLEVTQDRWHEKELFRKLDLNFARTIRVNPERNGSDRVWGLEAFNYPAILKTRRDGYDGKGQVLVAFPAEVLEEASTTLAGKSCVLEEVIDFVAEGSVIVARNPSGDSYASPVLENTHQDGILRETRWPPRSKFLIGSGLGDRARKIALDIAEALELEGVLAVEFFFTEEEIYVNELAPRPHNSGHGTIEAFKTSQFEQHVRAICNLPLGLMVPHSRFVMRNLIGHDIDKMAELLTIPTSLHIYNKGDVREGRKMGHYTTIFPDV
jgi:5-(carboxyamino)imidazole ribonucleotide synthase